MGVVRSGQAHQAQGTASVGPETWGLALVRLGHHLCDSVGAGPGIPWPSEKAVSPHFTSTHRALCPLALSLVEVAQDTQCWPRPGTSDLPFEIAYGEPASRRARPAASSRPSGLVDTHGHLLELLPCNHTLGGPPLRPHLHPRHSVRWVHSIEGDRG